ncbi:HD domain-containing protein 2 [Phytophthora pseudosyringae]|uniref:5'-deoxynucleotidase n=1 Tax=Phytophthora pseudosyringae TaxID=221518 RepID=A0A8T1VW79_9STRA|nr:HD domain-containing protein 2 [Phytophthora pseudosyringae]
MSMATGAKALSAIEFLRLCGRLKTLKRTGWVNNKVALPESVADHMYRMGMCCMLLDDANETVNRSKCIKMAIVHDLAESLVGDITPHDGVAEEDKHRMEKEALDEICNTLGDTPSAAEIRTLWNEYEAGSTEEAKVVKDFDKFEMILQADDYERAQNISLDDFFQSTKGKFRTPLVQSWVAELTSQRNARLEDKESTREK